MKCLFCTSCVVGWAPRHENRAVVSSDEVGNCGNTIQCNRKKKLFFWGRGSLSGNSLRHLGWPVTCSPHASVSWVLGSQTCVTTCSCFCLRQGFTMSARLTRSLLCSPGWPLTFAVSALSLPVPRSQACAVLLICALLVNIFIMEFNTTFGKVEWQFQYCQNSPLIDRGLKVRE